ncbi:hypothetical protein D5400_20550 [Georhizobium profundi]|uniref:Uncharacterized protein n=2 Tax=Georhizobium profundi TaxID=2341112 RepID=A0A3Q8XR98_9HYPH|nr:hypothetical protein D5400_20550 [Georhizobium profundi]
MGRDAELPPLPEIDGEDPLITIAPKPPKRPRAPEAISPLAQVNEATGDESASPVAPQEAQSKTPSPASMVKDRLVKPHPLIAGWIADHERRRREAKTNRDPWSYRTAPEPHTDLDRRRFRILDALFRALEARGAKVSESAQGQLSVTIDGQTIEFQVREKARQVKVVEGEGRSAYTRTKLVGTGKLTFAIKTYLRGRHNEERLETDKKPLETQLPAIIDRLFEGAVILKDWEEERAREHQRYEAERKRRAELQRVAEENEKRQAKLAELAGNWQTAQTMRAFIEAVKAVPHDANATIADKSVADWLTWAEETADSLDVSGGGPQRLFEVLGTVKAARSAWSV